MGVPVFPKAAVPQKSLESIRRLLEGLERGLTGRDLEVACAMKERHVYYTLVAARTLGVLTEEDELSRAGRNVLSQEPWSLGERDAWKKALLASPFFRVVVPDLLGDDPPSKDELAGRLQRLTGLSLSTATRRTTDILGWRRTILSQKQSQLLLADTRRSISADVIENLRRANPWWSGDAMRPIKPVRRAFVEVAKRRLRQNAAPIVVIKGPRQVGKSIAQEQIVSDLLSSGVEAARILRVQFDDVPALRSLSPQPILDLVAWYERSILKSSLNAAATAGRTVYLFVDEAQNVPDWSVQLKSLVDLSSVKVVLTGSSALRIQASADSLAGRTTTMEVFTLSLSEISMFRGAVEVNCLRISSAAALKSQETWRELVELGNKQAIARDAAFESFLQRGGYPRCHVDPDVPWEEVSPSLKADVIEKAIGHDARVGPSGKGRSRRRDVLEGVFRLACRHAGRPVGNDSIARDLSVEGLVGVTPELVREYLEWFDGALLLRLVRPLEARRRKSNGLIKICLVDHGLRHAYLADDLPLSPAMLKHAHQTISAEAGDLIESIVGSCLARVPNASLTWLPPFDGRPEVDFLLTIGDQRIPIEVKYRKKIRATDISGLKSFLSVPANRAPFGILVTQDSEDAGDSRIVAIPLSSLLLLAP